MHLHIIVFEWNMSKKIKNYQKFESKLFVSE